MIEIEHTAAPRPCEHCPKEAARCDGCPQTTIDEMIIMPVEDADHPADIEAHDDEHSARVAYEDNETYLPDVAFGPQD
jgi:hypothetical protein